MTIDHVQRHCYKLHHVPTVPTATSVWIHKSGSTWAEPYWVSVKIPTLASQNWSSSRASLDRCSLSAHDFLVLSTEYKALVLTLETGPIAKVMEIIWPIILAKMRAGALSHAEIDC